MIREVKAQVSHAGHLCRCLGVLAALQRPAKRGRLRHHPHPALLGGFSAAGVARRRACRRYPQESRGRHPQQGDRHRRNRLAERGPHARGGAAVAVEPGPRHRRRHWRWRSARISASTSSRLSISPGSASSKARAAAIGAYSTARPARRNSVSTASCPITRIGYCRRWPECCSPRLTFAAALVAGRGRTRTAHVMAADRRVGVPARGPVRLDRRNGAGRQFTAWAAGCARLAFAVTAAAAPIACAAACAAGRATADICRIAWPLGWQRTALSVALGASLIALTLLSVQTALGLVFDPRYRDLPFAPQSGARVAVSGADGFDTAVRPSAAGSRAMAETLPRRCWSLSAVYIAFNESFANWQAIWLCAGLIGLAVILERARDAPD